MSHSFLSPCPFRYLLPSMPCGNTSAWVYPDVPPLVSNILLSPEWHERNPSPACQCSEGKRLTMMPVCPLGAGGGPPRQRTEPTGDVMLDLTGHNISDYLVKTYPSLIRTRQVAQFYVQCVSAQTEHRVPSREDVHLI